jgi:hypothetical protein
MTKGLDVVDVPDKLLAFSHLNAIARSEESS